MQYEVLTCHSNQVEDEMKDRANNLEFSDAYKSWNLPIQPSSSVQTLSPPTVFQRPSFNELQALPPLSTMLLPFALDLSPVLPPIVPTLALLPIILPR